jgi:hypothetical protein
MTASGTITFGSDGTWSYNVKASGTWDGNVPASCVTNSDCAAIAQGLTRRNAPAATCASDGNGGCNCSTPAIPSEVFSAPYTVAGTLVADEPFCVEHGSMKLSYPAGGVFVMSQ